MMNSVSVLCCFKSPLFFLNRIGQLVEEKNFSYFHPTVANTFIGIKPSTEAETLPEKNSGKEPKRITINYMVKKIVKMQLKSRVFLILLTVNMVRRCLGRTVPFIIIVSNQR